MSNFYAVRIGRKPGIYETWDECLIQVHKFIGAKFKKFNNKDEALSFISGENKEIVISKEHIIPKVEIENKYFGNYPNFVSVLFDPYHWQRYCYIFTDGSHRNNPSLQYKSGYGVYFYDPSVTPIMGRNNTTNNYCEITAIEVALEHLIKEHMNNDKENDLNRKYIIVSDSQYCIKSITSYMPKWLLNNWKDGAIKHISKWKHIFAMLQQCNTMHVQIGFLHVKSHKKEPNRKGTYEHFLWYGNKCADLLATGTMVSRPNNNEIFGILNYKE